MLRDDTKEIFLLLIFSLLLHEYLTFNTIGFVILGALFVWFRIKPRKIWRNLLALAVFGSYWWTHGKVIDPEVGLNFLTTIIVLKILEKDSFRDRYMIFYGLILVISAGTLFEKSLTYVCFFTLSFYVLIKDFYSQQHVSMGIKDVRSAFLWVIPFTTLLFFVIPRLLSPIVLQRTSKEEGEVGYTPEVSFSQVEKLSFSDKKVFQAEVSSEISQVKLYWRGNILSFTDGWNWPLMPGDRSTPEPSAETHQPLPGDIKQSIRVFGKEEFFFALDHPRRLDDGSNSFDLRGVKAMTQQRWKGVPRYEVISNLSSFENTEDLDKYLRASLHNNEKDWIQKTFKSQNLRDLERELESYITGQGFSYSLSPGKITSFTEFMRVRRTGFCAHYASALALILRTKGIPARLVSGFMGGEFNRFAGFYLISQNDAHVWVEALDNGKWVRIDPTAWVAPDRVRLGGEAFMEGLAAEKRGGSRLFKRLKWLREGQQWFAQWDFAFYQFLEKMDYRGQDEILSKLKIHRKWLGAIAIIFLTIFMGLYLWVLSRKKPREHSEIEELWGVFNQKLSKKGLSLQFISVADLKSQLQEWDHAEKSKYLVHCEALLSASFEGKKEINLRELRKSLRDL
jgi:hypothetical protein